MTLDDDAHIVFGHCSYPSNHTQCVKVCTVYFAVFRCYQATLCIQSQWKDEEGKWEKSRAT